MNLPSTVRHPILRGSIYLVASLVLLYFCDVPSGQTLDAPIWQALLVDGDDADSSELKTLPLPDDQSHSALSSHGMDLRLGRQITRVSLDVLFPHDLLLSSIPARAPPAA